MSESYLEKALLKLSRQLNAYDEASLMSLWERYAEKVRHFEPTKKWEEAALVFSLIQSVRLKNQLFNHNWAKSREPDDTTMPDLAALTAPDFSDMLDDDMSGDTPDKDQPKRGKLLQLKPKK